MKEKKEEFIDIKINKITYPDTISLDEIKGMIDAQNEFETKLKDMRYVDNINEYMSQRCAR